MSSLAPSGLSGLFVVDVLSLASRMRRHALGSRAHPASALAPDAQALSELFATLSLPRLAACCKALASCSDDPSPAAGVDVLAVDLLDAIESLAQKWHGDELVDVDLVFSQAWMTRLPPSTRIPDPSEGPSHAAAAIDPASVPPRMGDAPPGVAAAQPSVLPSPMERARALHGSLSCLSAQERTACELEIAQLLRSTRRSHVRPTRAPMAVSAAPAILAALVRTVDALRLAAAVEIVAADDVIHLRAELTMPDDAERVVAASGSSLQCWGASVELDGRVLDIRCCADEQRWPVVVLRVAAGWLAVPSPQFRGLRRHDAGADGPAEPGHWLADLLHGAQELTLPCLGAGPAGLRAVPAWRYLVPADMDGPGGCRAIAMVADGLVAPIWSAE